MAANASRNLIVMLVAAGRGFWRDLFDSYRPELHYMRGPGPKWREKHASAERAETEPAGLDRAQA